MLVDPRDAGAQLYIMMARLQGGRKRATLAKAVDAVQASFQQWSTRSGGKPMPVVVRAALVAAAALLAIAGDAGAQSYPTKPIRLIVPYPAGGATDFFARLVFPKLGEALGQSVVVENRPGAGTAIGASEVARSAPDGYTILLGDAGTYAFNPALYRKLSYDPAKDFAPISLTGRFALILAVNPAVVSAGSVHEFVDAAKRQPGKIDYGAPGPGSPIPLAMELFKQRAGVTMMPIPYKGGADALSDLIGGDISARLPAATPAPRPHPPPHNKDTPTPRRNAPAPPPPHPPTG